MIGIDVGGANLKLVDGKGVTVHSCPLWQDAPLEDLLRVYRRDHPDPAAGVVMSGELADCFRTKMEGIRWIVDTVRRVYPDAQFYGTDGKFHDGAVPHLAAANWLAAAGWLREGYPNAVWVDMGSTTTDIIPLGNFDALLGLTDLLRLQRGYLVYTGLLRTPVAMQLARVTLQGRPTPLAAEHFAIAADAHLVLGNITHDQYTCDAPDRGEKTVEGALRRLARMVCADLDEIHVAGAREIAQQFWEAQLHAIRRGVAMVKKTGGIREEIASGIGSALLARELPAEDLRHALGPVSDALPAHAVREVAVRTGGSSPR
ncbi:MAG: H4MPT-linked C1 transfer pathway protein [Methanomicrobiales archaeon]|nr:H4MPT-linked C1 transfer pathway protein [Methanomicrobiales archaeon]